MWPCTHGSHARGQKGGKALIGGLGGGVIGEVVGKIGTVRVPP